MALDGTKSQVIRAAQSMIAQAQNAASANVAVLWQKSTETGEAFAKRLMTARTRLRTRRSILVAVCGYAVRCIAKSWRRGRRHAACDVGTSLINRQDTEVLWRQSSAGRSWSFARALIAKSLATQDQDSLHKGISEQYCRFDFTQPLSDQIELLGLNRYFCATEQHDHFAQRQ